MIKMHTSLSEKHRKKNIPVILKSRSWIDAHAQGRTHGGLIAQVQPRRFQRLSDLITENPYVFVVEGVEDPFNLGYIMRSLYTAAKAQLGEGGIHDPEIQCRCQ